RIRARRRDDGRARRHEHADLDGPPLARADRTDPAVRADYRVARHLHRPADRCVPARASRSARALYPADYHELRDPRAGRDGSEPPARRVLRAERTCRGSRLLARAGRARRAARDRGSRHALRRQRAAGRRRCRSAADRAAFRRRARGRAAAWRVLRLGDSARDPQRADRRTRPGASADRRRTGHGRGARPMNAAKRRQIFERFARHNPNPTTELVYSTPFELLVAVVLSAQSTDVGVNKATEKLFKVANTPRQMLELGEERLKAHINTLNFFNTKARNLIRTCSALVEQHGGEVPRDRDA